MVPPLAPSFQTSASHRPVGSRRAKPGSARTLHSASDVANLYEFSGCGAAW